MIIYQTDKNKTSLLQETLEKKAIKSQEVREWNKQLEEKLNQLKIQYITNGDRTTLERTKLYIDSLIKRIEDAGRDCLRKRMYGLLVNTYERR